MANIVVSQGFIGGTEEMLPTTLGREGSDYSAAIFAYVLNAESVTIWKDVPGLLNADPKFFPEAVKLEQISYEEAIELAYYGASVIHPKTLKPLQNKQIPLYVKPFMHPEESGSRIDAGKMIQHIPCYIFKTNQVLISIYPKDFSFIAVENLDEILKPSFTLEPKALTDGKNCDLGIVLHNTSQIGVITPDGNGGVDTTWQDLELNPEQCTWDFGDGTPVVHGFEPEHIYAQPGTYTVSLYIEDYERVCKSTTIDTTITFYAEYTEPQYAEDEVTTCEGKLPYFYKPDLFGYDNVTTRWDLNAVGERQVNYTNALPQYHIRSWNGCDSIVRVNFDVLTPAVTIL